MVSTPKDHQEAEILDVTDAEEAVFEALLPVYLAGRLDIEKVRQVNSTVAELLEDMRQGLEEAKAGKFYTQEDYRRMRSNGE